MIIINGVGKCRFWVILKMSYTLDFVAHSYLSA